MGYCYLNGRFLSEEESRISCLDRGFLYGDGLFETLPAYRGVPFLLDRHFRRLEKSCEALRLIPPNEKELKDIVRKLLEMNGIECGYIRVTLTRGKHLGDLSLTVPDSPTILVVAREYAGYPERYYLDGIRVGMSNIRRNPDSPLSRLKTLNYLESLMARSEATEREAEEVLLLNTKGKVAEASTANIFWACGDKVYTPSEECGVLPGIVRGWVLEKAGERGLETEVGEFPLSHLEKAEEIFLTNSLMGIMPVRQFRGRDLTAECPGPITRMLMEIYNKELSSLGR